MITKKEFLTEFNGHGNAYSSYMVIDVKLDDLINVLNEIDPDMHVGSGVVSDSGRSICFEICKQTPDLISTITSKLHCKGFADIGAWYGAGYFTSSYDGGEYNDFTAKWRDNSPDRQDDDDMEWDAFVVVTDNESQETFYTGEGACDKDTMEMWKNLVDTHRQDKKYI